MNIKAWFSDIKAAWREGLERDGSHSRIVPERLEGAGHGSSMPSARPYCFRCGSENIDSAYSNSHDRCRDCGFTTRFEPAAADLLPESDRQREMTVAFAAFVGGNVGIIERDLDGKLTAQRQATRKDTQARPMPVGGMR